MQKIVGTDGDLAEGGITVHISARERLVHYVGVTKVVAVVNLIPEVSVSIASKVKVLDVVTLV